MRLGADAALARKLPAPLVTLALGYLAYRSARTGMLDPRGKLELVVAASVFAGGLIVVVRQRPGLVPALILLLSALIPYQVSVVGKTPFGVVSAIGAIGAVALPLVLLVHLPRHGPLRFTPDIRLLGLWALVTLASALGSHDHRLTLNQARVVIVAIVVAYVVGRFIASLDPRALAWIVPTVAFIAVLAIAEEVLGFSLYDLVPTTGFPLEAPPAAVRDGLLRVRLGYYHGSALGTILVVALPLCLVRRRLARRNGTQIVVVVVLALFCTFTFQAWVAGTAAAAVVALGLTRVRIGLVLAAILASLVVSSGVVTPLNTLIDSRIHPTGSAADEKDYRLQLLPAAVKYADSGPLLGAGPGMFNKLGIIGHVRNAPVYLVDDNTYTAMLVETGYPGLALFLVALVAVGLRFARLPRGWRRWTGLGALAGWIVMSMSVDLLAGDQVLLPCWLILGMLSYSPPEASSVDEVLA